MPAAIMPAPSVTAVELMSTVNARPRSASGAPRCTSSALQTTVAPLPAPETTTQIAATQTLGEIAASPAPTAISASEPPYTSRVRRRSRSGPAARLPAASPKPAVATSRPNPKSPAWNEILASTTSETFTPAFAIMATFQATSTVRSGLDRRTSANPADRSRRWPSLGAARTWRRRPGMRRIRTADTTNVAALIQYAACGLETLTRMPPTSGPAVVVTFSIVWSNEFARGRSASLTRFGSPA